MTFSGLDENGNTNSRLRSIPLAQVGARFRSPFTPPLYPRMHLLPSGKVLFWSTPARATLILPHTLGRVVVATTNYSGTRTYGTSCCSADSGQQLQARGHNYGGGNPATNTTELIDLSAATPNDI